MVTTRITKTPRIIRDSLQKGINIFGKTLTHRTVTRTVDDWGQLSALTTVNTTFAGDLQFGLDLDQRFISSGIIEVGEGVLYIHPTALATLPVPQDQIIDGNSVWELVEQVESPELEGTVTFYSFRCKRRVNASDV